MSFGILRLAILLGTLLALAGCPPASPSTPASQEQGSTSPATASPAPAAVAGMVSGRVTYADGRPLADAHVVVIGFERRELDLQTDDDGVYEGVIGQLDANYQIAAWIDAPFEGQTYRFPLEPVGDPDTHFFGADGFAKDFVWQLTGRGSWASHLQPDDREGMIGGIVGVYIYDPSSDPSAASALDLPIGSTIELTLRPLTSLVDGSEAEQISGTITIDEETGPYTITEVGFLSDVPLARYEVTATVTEPGGSARALLIGAKCTSSGCSTDPPALADTAELSFPPANQSVHPGPYQGQPVAGLALYVTLP